MAIDEYCARNSRAMAPPPALTAQVPSKDHELARTIREALDARKLREFCQLHEVATAVGAPVSVTEHVVPR